MGKGVFLGIGIVNVYMGSLANTLRPVYREKYRLSRTPFLFCLLTISLFSLAATTTATAETYYLDAVNGDDTNPGTSELPWQTLSKAKSTVTGGNTVIVRDGLYGTYSEAYVDRTDWVTYQAETGHNPELTKIGTTTLGDVHNAYLCFDGFTIRSAAKQDATIELTKTKYVKFLNLNVIGKGADALGTGYAVQLYGDTSDVTIDNCTFSGGEETGPYDGFGHGMYVPDIDNLTITNNEIKQVANAGITASCRNNTIANNNIHQMGGDGMLLWGGDGPTLIEGNQIHDLNRYDPSLSETPTNTTWSADGITMTNGNATWGVDAQIEWERKMEIYINSGTNVKTGDNNVYVITIVSPTEIILSKSIKLDAEGATPSNVDYYIRDSVHGDLIQAQASSSTSNITIRNNIFYDCDGQIAWLNPAVPPNYDAAGGHNWVIENNLFYNTYISATDEYAGTVLIGSMDGAVFRNNIVIGRLRCTAPSNSDITIKNNIISLIQCGADNSHITEESYNIINRKDGNLFNLDETTAFLGGDWDNATFYNIFADSSSSNFQYASSNSLGVGHSDPANSPSTDILGNSRGASPDAGCYEYVSSDPNKDPVLQEIGSKSVNENSVLTFDVNATDPNGDTITYSVLNLPSGATFSSQTFSWTPGYEQTGTYQVTFIAGDGQAQDSETITITVNNTNRAPVLDSIGDKSVNENSTLNFSISATDADSDTITYSATDLPTGATLNSTTGTFTWTPGYTQAGTHQVTFTASDGQAQDPETITITVNNTNRDPVLDSVGNKSVYTESSLSFTISATDTDNDTITYSATGLPSGATFASQSFSWTPGQSQTGSHQVTFTASDGQTQDSETITITVTADTSAPAVSDLSPAADSIQAPLNTLITLHIVDADKGVDANSVSIKVNNNIVYTGNTDDYSSGSGHCHRMGTKANYTFIYQADEMLDFDQTVSVTANATDLAGNPMDEYSYSFKTEMRSFSKNKQVSSGSFNKGKAVTARNSTGDIWTVWHTGQTGNRDIYIGKLAAGADSFGDSVQITNNDADQCNPTIAIDSADKLYVAWQDSRNGEWDIYVSTSTDGISFSAERKITDPNSDQINPAMAIDSTNKVYIVWENDRNSNKDIYIASSNNSFVNYATSQITSNASEQTTPAIAVDSDNTVYVVWTDARGGTNDIYGAASNNSWTNAAIVNNVSNQSNPAIATESAGSILHLLWVDDTAGDNDIYYVASDALPSSPLSGSSIIDDDSGADQLQPAIAVTGSTGNDLKVFACWKDQRDTDADTDLYFVQTNSNTGTNVFIGDDSTNANQSQPAIATDIYGYPFLVWTDSRNTNTDIYYAGSTFVESSVLASKEISTSSDTTVGTVPAAIDEVDDVSVIVPAGAHSCDIKITISRVTNQQKLTLECFSLPYEFGPSGINFTEPVTITIPYEVSGSSNATSAYWYNPLTGTLSQDGITNVENIVISSTLHALRFRTTHFTQFLVGGGIAAVAAGGGGGGGCSISPNSQGSIAEFILPYIALSVAMTILKLRDRRKKKARKITESKC